MMNTSVFILLDELIESSSRLPLPDTVTESYQQAKWHGILLIWMEGERSRDDRAKGFFEIRKISVFTKSIGRSWLWIEKPQNGVGKPLEAIRVILQINARMYLKENHEWEEPFDLSTRFKCTQRYYSKNPRKWIGMFSGMRAILIKYLVVFRKWSLSYLA